MPSALVVFTSHPNSHPFQERHVYLEEPVTIGRSVARSRSAPNNATFDCKVLSRNHALVWFDHKTDKFYLQDNRSSNGTFINNHRLSQAGQGSPPTQILSGDVIQFGVDVTESNHSVTHGCIVSSVWLFLPNGVETLKRSDVTPSPSPLPVDKMVRRVGGIVLSEECYGITFDRCAHPLPLQFVANTPSVYSQELFQLSQYLQEALQREQMLEQKLATLQSLLASTQEASKNSWQALVDEDWLFSKLEVMGNMLQACSTNQTEEGVRELVALQKDKHNYESTTKEALRQILQEKVEVCQTLAKVERSLCSAQDTCLHLQHLKERAEDELTELANKYNTAVNLIKDLTNILKLAGQQQEGETQKLLKEKKELQLRINSVEEREQMLHANSDFTNQHLTSLQGCLEQLQDKITKNNIVENLLLTSGSDCRFIHQLIECQKVLNDHLHSNRTTQGISPYQPEKLKARLINSHLQNIMDEETQKGVNSGKVQMDAAEWVVSDTLGSCKDRTTKHCTVSQMDEQEQSAPVNKATPLTEEPGRGALPSSEAEQAVQLLTAQLREAQDQAVSSQRRYVELQDVFEQKRRETQLHTRESANQIQALQAQVQKLQGEVKVLRAERESVASSSQEEVQLLRRAMEASTNNWERESVSLQESLGSVTAELERWRRTAAECKEETVGLKARLQDLIQHSAQAAQLQGEVQKKCAGLQTECAALRAEKTALQENIQRLEKELHSSQDQGTLLGRNVSALERTQGELESRLAEQQDQHGQNSARLKAQLEQAAKRTKGLQREYEDTQVQLVQVKERCCEVEQEKLSLSQELQQCRSSLRQLQERASRFEETQVQLVQVEQEKLSLSELLQECRSSLRQLEERASCYEETQVQLVQVKERCCEVEQEKLSLSEELQECRSSLRQLQERASRPSLQPLLAVLVGMVLAVLFWGCSNLW